MTEQTARLPLFPSASTVNGSGRLVIGGCDAVELAEEFGTPLYVYDEMTLREKAREFRREFNNLYPTTVNYSCKAFLNKTVLGIFAEEGLSLDVVSGGEITVATAFGYPADRIDFPGNNKSVEELALAIETGVRRIVVDNFNELDILEKLTAELGKTQDILLRISPGIEPETHKYIITGNVDSKFGVPIVRGEEAVARVMSIRGVNLKGLHFHLGSQLLNKKSYVQAISVFIEFAAEMKRKHGFEMQEMSVGGGYAHRYLMEQEVPPVSQYAEAIAEALISSCTKFGLKRPRLIIEPGRALVAGAGVALYTAGVIKDIPGIRKYVSVDGGMGDNIMYALYGDRFEAVVANRMHEDDAETVTISGKYCESGDILIKDIKLPRINTGDIIAIPGSGAYNITQSMNYNAAFRPAVVLVKDGKARLIRRRETPADLMSCDV